MASVLVFSRGSNNQLRVRVQTGQPERGDVVDVHDDDLFHWGNAVMGPAALGWWQVVVVPQTPATVLHGLTTGAAPDVEFGAVAWRHRLWHVDLDALATGQLQGGTWVIPLERLMAAVAPKAQALKNRRSDTGLILAR